MTRQNKNIKKRITAKQFTEMHKAGQRGPKATVAKHGKQARNRIYNKPARQVKDTYTPAE